MENNNSGGGLGEFIVGAAVLGALSLVAKVIDDAERRRQSRMLEELIRTAVEEELRNLRTCFSCQEVYDIRIESKYNNCCSDICAENGPPIRCSVPYCDKSYFREDGYNDYFCSESCSDDDYDRRNDS